MRVVAKGESNAPDGSSWQALPVKLEARIIIIGPGLQRESSRRCIVTELSREQAVLQTVIAVGLPDHVFLQFADDSDVIGCAIFHINEDKVWVRFLRPLASGHVLHLAARKFEPVAAVPVN